MRTFYIEKDVRENKREDKKEFVDMVHEFEVYLRDSEMFEATVGFESQEGIGYRGLFEVDSKFDLRVDDSAIERGYATVEGTEEYSQRSSVVHPSNFKSVNMGKDREPLTLSKLAYGTATGINYSQIDFFQYISMRSALLSGGINHIDTGFDFR